MENKKKTEEKRNNIKTQGNYKRGKISRQVKAHILVTNKQDVN